MSADKLASTSSISTSLALRSTPISSSISSISSISSLLPNFHKEAPEKIETHLISSPSNISLSKSLLENDYHITRSKSRVKRSIIQLAGMIRCVSGCDPFMYKSYGCYCGYLGAGKPVDAIDR